MDGGASSCYCEAPNKEVPILRVVSLLSCAAVAFALPAAPAPSYRQRLSKVWVEGWEKPVDTTSGCRFTPDGDELRVTFSANGQRFGDDRRPLHAPRLLRHVRGDFVMEVRSRGAFRLDAVGSPQAGIVLMCGEKGAVLRRGVTTALPLPGPALGMGPRWHQVCGSRFDETGECYRDTIDGVTAWGESVHLRLERRGSRLLMMASREGTRWKTLANDDDYFESGKSVSVGVFAEANGPDAFEVIFDKFQLTPLK